MWTNEDRSLYDRSAIRYPSDLTDAHRAPDPACKARPQADGHHARSGQRRDVRAFRALLFWPTQCTDRIHACGACSKDAASRVFGPRDPTIASGSSDGFMHTNPATLADALDAKSLVQSCRRTGGDGGSGFTIGPASACLGRAIPSSNPIEQVFSNLKHELRKAAARPFGHRRDTLIALSLILSGADRRNFHARQR